MKKITFILLMCISNISVISQIKNNSITDKGDIAIVAYHDDPDGFSFVLLDDCPDGTSIRFIDEEWTGTEFASATAEGEVLWANNTGSSILQGTVIHIENASDNSPGISASTGTASEIDGGFILGINNDEIIAITGTRSSPGTFLTYFGDSDNPGSQISGTGLTDGTNALFQSTVTEGYYNGPNHCTGLSLENCSKQLNNISNWIFGNFTFPDVVATSIFTGGVLHTNTLEKAHISFKPNPVTDVLTIETEASISRVTIYNIAGKQVLIQAFNRNNPHLKLTHLKQGIYYVRLYSNTMIYTFQIQKI